MLTGIEVSSIALVSQLKIPHSARPPRSKLWGPCGRGKACREPALLSTSWRSWRLECTVRRMLIQGVRANMLPKPTPEIIRKPGLSRLHRRGIRAAKGARLRLCFSAASVSPSLPNVPQPQLASPSSATPCVTYCQGSGCVLRSDGQTLDLALSPDPEDETGPQTDRSWLPLSPPKFTLTVAQHMTGGRSKQFSAQR